jgi:hypothetical protein
LNAAPDTLFEGETAQEHAVGFKSFHDEIDLPRTKVQRFGPHGKHARHQKSCLGGGGLYGGRG